MLNSFLERGISPPVVADPQVRRCQPAFEFELLARLRAIAQVPVQRFKIRDCSGRIALILIAICGAQEFSDVAFNEGNFGAYIRTGPKYWPT